MVKNIFVHLIPTPCPSSDPCSLNMHVCAGVCTCVNVRLSYSNPEYHSKYTQNDSNDNHGDLPQFYRTCKGQGEYNMLFIIITFEAISG